MDFPELGGDGGIRTLGLRVANAALSQLSYAPLLIERSHSITFPFKSQYDLQNFRCCLL